MFPRTIQYVHTVPIVRCDMSFPFQCKPKGIFFVFEPNIKPPHLSSNKESPTRPRPRRPPSRLGRPVGAARLHPRGLRGFHHFDVDLHGPAEPDPCAGHPGGPRSARPAEQHRFGSAVQFNAAQPYTDGLTTLRSNYASTGRFATYYMGGAAPNVQWHQHLFRSRFYDKGGANPSPGIESIADFVSKFLGGTIEQVGP